MLRPFLLCLAAALALSSCEGSRDEPVRPRPAPVAAETASHAGADSLRAAMERFLAPVAEVYFGGGEAGAVPINDTTIESFGVMSALARDRQAVDARSNDDFYLIHKGLADRRATETFGRASAGRGLDPWKNQGGYTYRDGFYRLHRYDVDLHEESDESYRPLVRSVTPLPDGRFTVDADIVVAPAAPGDSLFVDHRITATVARTAMGRLRLDGYVVHAPPRVASR